MVAKYSARGLARELDSLGRVVIPKEMIRGLGINRETELDVRLEKGKIAIHLDPPKIGGIVRFLDELNRVVLPKEMRYTIDIEDGACLDIFIEDNVIYMRDLKAPVCVFCGCEEENQLIKINDVPACRHCIIEEAKKLTNN